MEDAVQDSEDQLDFFDGPSNYETAAGISRILAGARTVSATGASMPSFYDGTIFVPDSASQSMKQSLVNAAWGHWSWIDKISLPPSITDDDAARDSLTYIETKRIEHRASGWYGRDMADRHSTAGYAKALEGLVEGRYNEAIENLQFKGAFGIQEGLATQCADVLTEVFLPIYEVAIRSKDKVAGVRAALQYAALIHEFETRPEPNADDDPPGEKGKPQDSQGQDGVDSDPDDSDTDDDAKGKELSDYLDDAELSAIDAALASIAEDGRDYDKNGHKVPIPIFRPNNYRVVIPAQVENPLSETLRVKLDIEGKRQSISRLRQYGKVTKKIYRMRYGDTRVFAAPEHNQARVMVLVDNSASTAHGRRADTMWNIVAAITALFTDATVMTYHMGTNAVVIGMVEVGNKLADEYDRTLAVAGQRIKSSGFTPDAEALLYVEQEARTVGDVLLVHICDGTPDNPEATSEVAHQLYESGLRYATICVGYDAKDGIYPSEVVIKVDPPMGDKDWQKIEGLLSYVIQSNG
jgi:hypothetical protein